MKVNVELIRKTTFNFEVEAVLDSNGDIDEEATKDKVYDIYSKATDTNNLYGFFYDEDIEYGDIEEI